MLKLTRLTRAVFCIAIVLITETVIAQSRGTQYVYRNWNNKNGLPQNTVNDMIYDSDGYLWAATEAGIVRFNGSEFIVRNEHNTAGLFSSVFYDLSPSEIGIWAGSRNSVLLITKKQFKSFDLRPLLHREWIKTSYAEPYGRLWIGTAGSKLLFIENDSIHTHAGWSNEKLAPIDKIYSYRNELLISTVKGLYKLVDEKPTFIERFNDIQITTMESTRSGHLWLGTADHGVFRISPTDTIQYKEGLNELYINSIAEGPEGSIWVGTRNSGFQILSDGKFYTPDQENYSHVGIRSILFANNNLVWLGTNSSGLVQVKPAQLSRLPRENSLTGEVILPIYQHPSGEIWIGTAGKGINRIRDGVKTNYSTANSLSNNLILSVYGTETHIYVGTANGLNQINLKSGKLEKIYSKADGLLNNTIGSIFYDSGKRLWITSRMGGIYTLEKGKLQKKDPLPALRNTNFISIFEDSRKNIWLGSRGAGAIRIDSLGKWELFHQEKKFPADIVFGFYEDELGCLWMATDKGLVCYENDRFTLLDNTDGLVFNEIYRLLADDKNFLWLSGNFGLQRVSITALREAVRSGKPAYLPVRLFNTIDGMVNAETNGGIFPAGWKMQDGTLWFPTTEGVSIVDTRLINEEINPVNINLELIRYADKELHPDQEVLIPANVYNIEIKYSSIDFTKASEIKYYYRLKGLSNSWIDAGDRQVAYFSELSPGTYHFEVKAELYGQWSDTAVWTFSVEPHFYQTTGFKVFILLLLAGLVLWILYSSRRKQRRKLAEQKKIIRAQLSGQEKERQFLGSELHDNINQRLATAKLYLNFAKTNDAERISMIEKGEDVIQHVISDIRNMCKSLIPPTMNDIGLAEALQELMSSYHAVKKFNVHFDSTALLDRLEEDLRFSLFRIIQEQLNNIATHAEAKNVWVVFRYRNGAIDLRIRDDGKGFEIQKPLKGRGLGNIRQRLELFEGKLEIQSAPGEGCTLKITVPLNIVPESVVE